MKRRLINHCALAIVACGLLGCSIHPLPQDVSSVSTVDIVKKIRCEAKEGFEAALEKAASQGALSTKHVEKIASVTTIGFDFRFVMAEDNKAAVTDLTFERPSSTPGDGLKLTLLARLNGDLAKDDNT